MRFFCGRVNSLAFFFGQRLQRFVFSDFPVSDFYPPNLAENFFGPVSGIPIAS